MKKNKNNLLIPAGIILVLVLVLGFLLLRENILDLFQTNKNALTRIEGYPKVIDNTKRVEKKRVVVNNKEEFDTLMNEILDNPSQVPLPEINFENNRLLVVTTETNETKGFRIKVAKAVKNVEKNELEVVTENQKPGKSCSNPEEKNISIDMVIIEKSDMKVNFERVDKTIDCDTN